MSLLRFAFTCGVFVILFTNAYANQTGINGRSGKHNGRFCASCHSGANYGTAVLIAGPNVLLTNQRATYTVTIQQDLLLNPNALAAGFNVAVERVGGSDVGIDPSTDPMDDDDGTLFSIEDGTQLLEGEITHTAPRAFSGNQVVFTFQWEPHISGSYQIFAAGNAVDLSVTDQNDHPALAQAPVNVTVCDDSDADGVCNAGIDNCPLVPNPVLDGSQPDCDSDGVGDACDTSCTTLGCSGLCFPGTCGDGYLDASVVEDCDDGNLTDDGNGCSATCQKNSVCGDTIQQTLFETCDNGNQNSDTVADACRTTCVVAFCGDGVVDSGETCDDGNSIDDGNGCDVLCQINAVCGNGVLEDQIEDCDDGNTVDTGNGCSSTCQKNSVCGNNVVESAFEYCDDGNPLDTGNGCSSSCQRNDVCGDGLLAIFEQCDDGDTIDSGNGCSSTCQRNDVCGDTSVAALFEQCDNGSNNSNSSPNACRLNCQVAHCGDGVVDANENCDDGAANSDVAADSCRTNCSLPNCGDGVVDFGEQCDEGTQNSATTPDRCRPDCNTPRCGDTVRDVLAGEGCDDGDLTNGDGCSAQCVPESCGDNFLGAFEECDAGANNSNTTANACRTNCVAAFCGDGVRDTGEQCDQGISNSDSEPDRCRRDCQTPTCGDGVVDSNEECDTADSATAKNCQSDCLLPSVDEGCQNTPPSLLAPLLLALVLTHYCRRSTTTSI